MMFEIYNSAFLDDGPEPLDEFLQFIRDEEHILISVYRREVS